MKTFFRLRARWLARHTVGSEDSSAAWESNVAEVVAVSGNYAYVAGNREDRDAGTWQNWLRVIDISNPANPRQIGGTALNGRVRDVAISGHYAYLMTSQDVVAGTSVNGL